MAAVAKTDPILVSPPGEWAIDKGWATQDIVAGDPIVITNAAPPSRLWEQSIARATGTVAHGIALKDCTQGGTVEYAAAGEMDGFTGLTRGAPLTIAAGNIDNAPALDVNGEPTVPSRIRAVTTTRIRFFLV